MTSTPRIGILAGTVREGRNSIKIADWAQQTLAAAGIDATFEVIDLAAQELGKFTSATPPRACTGGPTKSPSWPPGPRRSPASTASSSPPASTTVPSRAS
ncbi:NADPH-dependent FMN reductase [Corynebacterium variabile]|uniref:NADPH-dependent FMN reductase n=1 Tax=Corynebacterium variabile TaxID=1727 RepID=UPI003FD42019